MKKLLIVLNMIWGTFFTFSSIFIEDTILAVIGVGMLINANTICFSKQDVNHAKVEGEKNAH